MLKKLDNGWRIDANSPHSFDIDADYMFYKKDLQLEDVLISNNWSRSSGDTFSFV